MQWLERDATREIDSPDINKIRKAGYRILHDLRAPVQRPNGPPVGALRIRVLLGDVLVGWVSFERRGEWLSADTETGVDPGHQRRGICTAMYVYAEKLTGCTIADEPMGRSEAGNAFWAQSNRPFGPQGEQRGPRIDPNA